MLFNERYQLENYPDIEPETYQGNASQHNVIIKHINQVHAAEHKHQLEFQSEKNQLKAEQRIRYQGERAELQMQIDLRERDTHLQHIQLLQQSTHTELESSAPNTETTVLIEETDMNLKHLAATALTVGTLASTSACSQEELNQPKYNSAGEKIVTGDDFRISKNPNPQKGYKLKVKINNAPGTFKYVYAGLVFRINNIKECGYFIGGAFQNTVPGVADQIDFPLTKLSDTEYEGVFYTDWAKDGDFFGKGVCHWRLNSIGAGMRATNAKGETYFLSNINGDKLYDGATEERFYRKSEYPRSQFLEDARDGGIDHLENYTPEQIRDLTFSVTITAEELK